MPQSTLLVVIDPTSDNQTALKRAEQLAVDTGARLHLFCCYQPEDIGDFHSRHDAKHTTLLELRDKLEALAKPLREEGLAVSVEPYWNQNWQESVVHACGRNGAGMVIKSSYCHRGFLQHLRTRSDFTLIRKAPCATLLVKEDAPWTNQRILAAVNIDTADAEHDMLNNVIVTEAQRLANATQSDLHLVAAMDHTANMADVLGLLEDEDQSRESAIAERFGVNLDRVHIRTGKATEAILEVTNDINADVLVLGTVARHGLQGALIGNTAEKVIDQLDVDVLTVT
ncbi:MAG: universal stress protein [Candidatus Pelagadaptatus aseana]|uniref:universal stress protein n=1 Tax=Candidatus Pelagadaptatus aseana TaxID=3120508 RepID=UPI0039B354BA